ncbi:MAG: triple tyrosine motif-containing protein [Bacteroidota bacterium]
MIRTIDRMDGLFNKTVLSLFEDQTGNLWAGLDQGISYLEINSPFTQIDGNHNLQGTPYTSAFWKGKLYLGTTNGVFQTDQESLFEPLGHPRFDLLPEAKGQAYKLQVIDNQLLLAHHRGGFVIKDNHATPLGGSEGSWMFLELKAFPGYMVGGTYTGLDLFKKDNRGTWKYIRSFPSFTESSRYLEQDKAGNLWVAHGNKGAFKVTFSPDLTSIQEVKQYGAEDGFPSNIFVDVHRVGQKLVFTAEKGCYQYNPDTDRFEPHELLNEIFSADVYVRKLVEDPKGNVWYQAEEEFGVLMVQDEGLKKHLKRVSVQKLSGRLLPGYEHINPNIFKGVLVGTQEGFVYFNPTDYPNPKSQFKSLIRSVEAIGESDSLLIAGTSGQSGKDPYKVPNYFNAFRFKFAAPFYEDVDKMQFSYMLEGFDQGWSEWRNVFQKEYTNLPSGTYTFMVKAKNIYQQESQIGKFTFSVSQPWYKGRGTALGVFFTLVLGIFFFFLSKNRVLEKEKKLLQMEQEKSIRKQEAVLYKQKAQSEREIMALKNEKLQSEIAHKTKELTSSAMHLVQKGEVLLKIKQELEKVRGELSGPTKGRMTRLIKTIDDDIKFDKNWEKFEYHFDSVHENFLKLLREQYPNLTPKDQKMCAYLRMNLSTKEIAPLMNISVRGVEISRYRLRKKLDLDTGTNLVEFLQQLKPKNPDS